ncbi:MAG TPA: LUD domain-containing protein [Acidimicrobiia bacterium]|nr:LUD domain-containing protein [Acidimicrobiia bacterium]
MDRDTFLTRVGQASLTSILPDTPPTNSLVVPDGIDLLDLFRVRAQAVNAVIHGPVTRHGAPRVVTAIAGGHDAETFMVWDDLPVSGVPSGLQALGMRRVDHIVGDERGEQNLAYQTLDIGVTGALGALAESGSLILTHGPGRPRMASLIADVHIALLDLSTLEWTLADWAAKNPALAARTTNLVLVTGPSRTGDIEQQLNLGVHGPRHVHIVMIR